MPGAAPAFAKSLLDLFSCFDTVPACDEQTDSGYGIFIAFAYRAVKETVN